MKKKRGFTLVEILAGFLIVSILSVSVTAVILNGITTTNDRRARILATSVAEYYIQSTKNILDTENLVDSYTGSVVNYKGADEIHYDEDELSTSATILTKTGSYGYLNDYKNSGVYKSLFDDTQKFVLDGVAYDSSLVTVKVGVKSATSNGTKYKIGYVVVTVKYYKDRTMEVIRDVY